MKKMNTPTYYEQWMKLTTAYVNGEVDPFDCKACFVGNLLNNNGGWGSIRNPSMCVVMLTGVPEMSEFKGDAKESEMEIIKESNGLYSKEDIAFIEAQFLYQITKNGGEATAWALSSVSDKDENALFIAFEKTLEVLKQIHIEHGEVIDEVPVFTKRLTLHPIK